MDASIALLIGFLGALIGAFTSIITMVIQLKSQNKRERLRAAANLALEDYKLHIELAKEHSFLPPIVIYLHYHLQIMKRLEKGNLNERVLRKITTENQKLIKITKDLSDKVEGRNKDK